MYTYIENIGIMCRIARKPAPNFVIEHCYRKKRAKPSVSILIAMFSHNCNSFSQFCIGKFPIKILWGIFLQFQSWPAKAFQCVFFQYQDLLSASAQIRCVNDVMSLLIVGRPQHSAKLYKNKIKMGTQVIFHDQKGISIILHAAKKDYNSTITPLD